MNFEFLSGIMFSVFTFCVFLLGVKFGMTIAIKTCMKEEEE